MTRVAVEVEGMEPDQLTLSGAPPHPVEWRIVGPGVMGDIIHIEGERDDVEFFIDVHWGPDEIGRQAQDQIEWFAAHAVELDPPYGVDPPA